MKQKTVSIFLAVEAVLCLAVYAPLAYSADGNLTDFPFLQIAELLMKMSLSGGAGNVFAIVLYVLVSLLPCLMLIPVFLKKRKFKLDDALAVFTSALLFIALYLMINPLYISQHFIDLKSGRSALCLLILMSLISCAAIRLFRAYLAAGAEYLKRQLSILLVFIAAALVFALCGVGFANLIISIQNVRISNTAFSSELFPTYVMLCAEYLISAFTVVVELIIVFRIREILKADTEEKIALADKLAVFCTKAFSVSLLATLAFCVVQAVISPYLAVSFYKLNLPVGQMVVILIVLIFSRLIAENKKLKDDNDLFI